MWWSRASRNPKHDQAHIGVFLQQVNQILVKISEARVPQEIYPQLIRSGTEFFHIDPASSYLRIANWQSNSTKLLFTAVPDLNIYNELQDLSKGITGRAMKTGKAQIIRDVRRDPEYYSSSPLQVRSELAMPIMQGPRCLGVLNFEASGTGWFSHSDVQWAQLLAEIAALVETTEQQREENQSATILAQTHSNKVSIASLLDEVLQTFPGPIVDLMAEVMSVEANSSQLVTLAMRPETAIGLHIRLRRGEGITGEVFATDRAYVGNIGDRAKLRGTGSIADSTHLLSTQSALVVPLHNSDGQFAGILNIESKQKDRFTTADLSKLEQQRLLQSLAAAFTADTLREDDVIKQLLHDHERSILGNTDPEHLDDTYRQILQAAAQYMAQPDVAGALLLLRDEASYSLSQRTPATVTSGWITVTATLGEYHPEKRERSLAEPSITKRALMEGKAQRIADVNIFPEYWSSGKQFISELNVPLLDGANVLGTIDLVSPIRDAFSPKDEINLTRFAKIAVQAIKRIAEIEQYQRSAEELKQAIEIQQRLAELSAPNNTVGSVNAICQNVMAYILSLAIDKTTSQLGQVLIAQRTQHGFDLVNYASAGAKRLNAPDRWSSNQGVTGKAFSSQTIKFKDDTDVAYLEYFTDDVQSEMAVPLIIGKPIPNETQNILGVLNVESNVAHHYTQNHRHWVEFLAKQTAFAYKAVVQAIAYVHDAALQAYTKAMRDGIADLPTLATVTKVNHQRNKLRLNLLRDVCALLGDASGTLYIVVGADRQNSVSQDAVDTYGRFVEVATAPIPLPSDEDLDSFPLSKGVSGTIYRTKQPSLAFNTVMERPSEFHGLRGQNLAYVRSGAIVPIYEGLRIIGMMEFISPSEGTFPLENVALVEQVGQLLSEIIVAARLRVEEIQAEVLREFERDVLQMETPDTADFMRNVLITAQQLTDSSANWGQVARLRRYPTAMHGETELRIWDSFSLTYDQDTDMQLWKGTTIQPQIVTPQHNALFHRVFTTQRSILLTDVNVPEFRELKELFGLWPGARALICAPLIGPSAVRKQGESEALAKKEVVGVLTVASAKPLHLNDADAEVLSLFGQTVTLGLQNLDLLDARRQFINLIAHDLGKTIYPVFDIIEAINVKLARQPIDRDTVLAHVREEQNKIADLFYLTNDILFAFRDLTDAEIFPVDLRVPLPVAEIINDMQVGIAVLAARTTGHQVHWPAPLPPFSVPGGDTAKSLIKVALFQYIVNALSYGNQGDVYVTIDLQGETGTVIFRVISSGAPIDEKDRPFLFELGFRGSNLQTNIKGSGLGLYQVRRAAELLRGGIGYEPLAGSRNAFLLTLPLVLSQTIRKQG